MSKQYCFFCASDEGVLLDVTADNKQIFREQLEICLFPKESVADALTSKICYKCAFELKQCTSFVQRYKQSCTSSDKVNTCMGYCNLCSEPAQKGHLFDLSGDNTEHNLVHKIEKIFSHDQLAKCLEGKNLICVSCRYTVDVLFDLKCIFEATTTKLKTIPSGEIDYLQFPKIKTTVVSRKTTITESTRIISCTEEDFGSNSSKMARGQTRATRLKNKSTTQTTSRLCGKCHNAVENPSDMYRIHTTRLTVCKTCWINTNQTPTQGTKKRTRQSSTETKSCTVFLKDVLTDSAVKDEKLYRVEEDGQGNKVYIITDESSEGEQKLQKEDVSVTVSPSVHNTAKPGQKRTAKSIKTDSTDSEPKPSKKQKADKEPTTNSVESEPQKEQEPENSPDTLPPARLRGRSRNRVNNETNKQKNNRTLSPNIDTPAPKVVKKVLRNKKSSWSDADVNTKDKKKLRTILKGIPILDTIDLCEESSSNEDLPSRRKRIRFASASPVTIQPENEKKQSVEKAKSPPTPTTEIRPSRAKKLKVVKPKSIESDDKPSVSSVTFDAPLSPVAEDATYVCDECEINFENRLAGLTHKLTHYPQLELSLTRVTVPSVTNDDETLKDSDSAEQSVAEPAKEESQSQPTKDSNQEDEPDWVRRDSRKESEESNENENTCEITLKDDANVEDAQVEKVDGAHEDEEPTQKTIEETEVQKEKAGEEEEEEKEDGQILEKEKEDEETQEKENESVETQEQENESVETQEKEKEEEEPQGKENESVETQQEEIEDTETEEKCKKTVTDAQEEKEDADVDVENTEQKEKDVDRESTEEKEKDAVIQEEVEKEATEKEPEVEVETNREVEKQVEPEEQVKPEMEFEKEKETQDETDKTEEDDKPREEAAKTTNEVEKDDDDGMQMVTELGEEDPDVCITKSNVKSKPSEIEDIVVIDENESSTPKKNVQNGIEEKEVESETDIRIIDTGSSEDSVDKDVANKEKVIEIGDDNEDEVEITLKDDMSKSEECIKLSGTTKIVVEDVEETVNAKEDVEIQEATEKSSDSANAAAVEVLKEVFDLATAEVQKRQPITDVNENNDNTDTETLENISREIENSAVPVELEADNGACSK